MRSALALRAITCVVGTAVVAFVPGCGGSRPTAATPQTGQSEWSVVWADEFEGTGLPDLEKWYYDVGGHGWGNKELQFYTERRIENTRVEGGRLIVEARREHREGRDYTSARLNTRQ